MQINNLPASSFANAVWAATTRNLTAPSGIWSETTRNLTSPSGIWGEATRNLTSPTGVWSDTTRTLTVGAGNIVGSTLQAPATVSAISLTSVATTSIINFSGAGGVMAILGLSVGTALGTGATTAQFNITPDGNAQSINIYNAGSQFSATAQALNEVVNGNGGASGNSWRMYLAVQFTSTLVVSFQVTASTLSAGTANCTVLWAHS